MRLYREWWKLAVKLPVAITLITACVHPTGLSESEPDLRPLTESRVVGIELLHARRDAERWVRRGEDPGIGPYFLLRDDTGRGCLVTKAQSERIQSSDVVACAWTMPRPAIGLTWDLRLT